MKYRQNKKLFQVEMKKKKENEMWRVFKSLFNSLLLHRIEEYKKFPPSFFVILYFVPSRVFFTFLFLFYFIFSSEDKKKCTSWQVSMPSLELRRSVFLLFWFFGYFTASGTIIGRNALLIFTNLHIIIKLVDSWSWNVVPACHTRT